MLRACILPKVKLESFSPSHTWLVGCLLLGFFPIRFFSYYSPALPIKKTDRYTLSDRSTQEERRLSSCKASQPASALTLLKLREISSAFFVLLNFCLFLWAKSKKREEGRRTFHVQPRNSWLKMGEKKDEEEKVRLLLLLLLFYSLSPLPLILLSCFPPAAMGGERRQFSAAWKAGGVGDGAAAANRLSFFTMWPSSAGHRSSSLFFMQWKEKKKGLELAESQDELSISTHLTTRKRKKKK